MLENDNYLWVEKYRPRKIADCVLPAETKKTFQEFLTSGNIPNLLLSGGPGTGKTTVARALLEELDADYYFINASNARGIGMVQEDIPRYASSVSMTGGRKYILLDEADNLTPDAQKAFRGVIEQFSKNCGFIITCNYKNRLIEPIHSRFVSVDFKIDKSEMAALAGAFFKRACFILKTEGIEFDKGAVAELTKRYLPDWRRTIGELQRYSAGGKIDAGILAKSSNVSIDDLIKHLKGKDYTNTRKWVADNLDNESQGLIRKLFDTAGDHLKPASVAQLVLILGEYQYKAAFVADQEINILSMLTECMLHLEFN
jgi:DNA polymerase III delta prime subunit